VLAPLAFASYLPGVQEYADNADVSSIAGVQIEWLVVHKDNLDRLALPGLAAALVDSRLIFANEVFGIFALSPPERRADPHIASFIARLRQRGQTRGVADVSRSNTSGTAEFAAIAQPAGVGQPRIWTHWTQRIAQRLGRSSGGASPNTRLQAGPDHMLIAGGPELSRPEIIDASVPGVVRNSRMSEARITADADDPEPSLDHPISQACTQAQLDTDIYRYWCAEIREIPRYHRKQWEFCYILQALATAGRLGPGQRGLGFGVGAEPLTAVFAARGCEVVATDLDPDNARKLGWIDSNQHAAELAALNERGICPPERFNENVRFCSLDMNAIPEELQEFDFTWSACALEHLGSIRLGLAFIENSLRTLRPGGIAVHTTEFNCSSDTATRDHDGTVLFRKQDILALTRRLEVAGHRIQLNFNLGDQPLDRHVDVAPYSSDQHLKLRIGEYASTSFGIIIQKSG
jgi:SAM-dependent methyltransferase